jgi:hypothetical protein
MALTLLGVVHLDKCQTFESQNLHCIACRFSHQLLAEFGVRILC